MSCSTSYTYRGKAKIPKVQTKQKVSRISLVRRPSSESEASEIPLLLNHDYLEDSRDKRNSLIYYNPTVPLPAFYQPPPQPPPDDIGLDFEVAEAASYYNRKPNVSELHNYASYVYYPKLLKVQ